MAAQERTVALNNLINRLEKGKDLVVKRKWFFKAGNWANWAGKNENRKQATIFVLAVLGITWVLLMTVIAILLPSLSAFMIERAMVPCLVIILVVSGLFFSFLP